MNFQKGFSMVLTLGIVALLFIGGGAYLYKNNQIPGLSKPVITDTTVLDTSSWKTYTNTQYKFSFKYPPTLRTIDGVNTDKYGQVLLINLVSEHSNTPTNQYVYGMTVLVRDQAQKNLFNVALGNINAKQTLTIDGISMALFDSTIVVNANGKESSANKKNSIFQMGEYAINVSTSDNPDFSPYFYTILTTFKNE